VRVLGIETSSDRGSVALVDGGAAIATLTRHAPGAHGEHLRNLVDELFASTGWAPSSLDRIAVGVGPGSFTGLRVGMAFGEGCGLALHRPVVGVSSLQAMCRGVPGDRPGLRCAVLDARRNDVFVAACDPNHGIAAGPSLVNRDALGAWLDGLPGPGRVFVGQFAAELDLEPRIASEMTDLPHAVPVAELGAEAPAGAPVAEATYVRSPDAIRPDLARNSAIFRTPK
jgi:tRNA threonylcarbamoyladenosine biosynthesis protein TsaB